MPGNEIQDTDSKSTSKKPDDKNIKTATTVIWQEIHHVHWGKVIAIFLVLVGVSIGIVWAYNHYASRISFPIHEYAWLAYLIVFLVMVGVNLTIMAPLPIGISIMIAVASEWNPVMAALFASLGGAIGELSGYYAGYLGRKVSLKDADRWQGKFQDWVQRWGAKIIFLLSLQPFLPFDVAGIAGGATKMPVRKFLLACFLGRWIKYILYAYFGAELIKRVPFISN